MQCALIFAINLQPGLTYLPSRTSMPTSITASEAINSKLELFEIYNKGKYLSVRHDSYFQVYDQVFSKYRGRNITFVEIGILGGGSIFMWREYFGHGARIIGIDVNPAAKKWEQEGFEIFIGDQADPAFWQGFYREVGAIDILLDDGGHTNKQQITTALAALEQIRDGGVLMVEDVHTSYFRSFGNPSRHSFVSFAKRVVDSLNSRSPGVNAVKNEYGKKVFTISFYESIVAFHIDSQRCFLSNFTNNGGIRDAAPDMRHAKTSQSMVARLQIALEKRFSSRLWVK